MAPDASFFPAAALAKLNDGLTFAAGNFGDVGAGDVGLARDDDAVGGVVREAGVSRSRTDAASEDVLDMLCCITFSFVASLSFSSRSATRASLADTSTGLEEELRHQAFVHK